MLDLRRKVDVVTQGKVILVPHGVVRCDGHCHAVVVARIFEVKLKRALLRKN